ncbi:diacylglycerol O-acyltransferas-like protein 2B [Westerdykella ornata]|uniref:diacylglycerol O-acyltransferase n=1 Tax=Westerdykella ornata TaxID=318751 RepID=A0A6A6JWS1_WESOR|nr:diacylglycerol O-acyltransferas-like protein 2B [Westerdykella ornata]KAF2281061.1 diacylglycerol O-acyltransferas-like protein 2B [Westerdykella ornata]
MALPAEPAAPQERKAHNLAPKSYDEAAEEALSPGPDEQIRNPNPEPADPNERKTRHLPPKSYAEAAKEDIVDAPVDMKKSDRAKSVQTIQANGKITIPTSEDKEHYEGRGEDDSPRSPDRRRSSVKSLGSPRRKHGGQLESEIFEKHQNGTGMPLTSVKVSEKYAKSTRTPDAPRRRTSTLMSGKQAGAGWQKSKIRFAPLNVPLQRRLQTLAVLIHTLTPFCLLTIFFFLCSIPLLWPILLPYVIFVLFSNAGISGELSYRSERIRRLRIWSLFASYFPARLHRTYELEPTRKYVFGYHPHGIISHGAFAAFATEALGFSQLFPGITNTLLTLDTNFKTPLYREYALYLGLGSVSRQSIDNILSKGGVNGEGMGRAVTIVVGGAREALEAKPGTIRLLLLSRKGFVKRAIANGADLVPVLAFGESDIYQQVDASSHPYLHAFQLAVKKLFGFTMPIFHARGVFNYDVGMLPYRKPINIVVGKPIQVVQSRHPDDAYVAQIHSEYIKELLRIWDDYKDDFAKDRTSELEIIE